MCLSVPVWEAVRSVSHHRPLTFSTEKKPAGLRGAEIIHIQHSGSSLSGHSHFRQEMED